MILLHFRHDTWRPLSELRRHGQKCSSDVYFRAAAAWHASYITSDAGAVNCTHVSLPRAPAQTAPCMTARSMADTRNPLRMSARTQLECDWASKADLLGTGPLSGQMG